MAQDKKSFILYADLIHTVMKLPDENAGRVLKAILSNVNSQEYTIDDLLAEVVFEPIKQQLNRDLGKYNDYLLKQSANGKKGGRPPQVETQINPKNPSLKNETQKTLNDNDSVNDSDNVNENENETVKNKKPDKPDPVFIEYPFGENFLKIWNEWKYYKKKEFRFDFKTIQSEQAAICDLVTKANGNEQTAILIIQQSMANGWKGLFELKENSNLEPNSTTRQQTGKITNEQLEQAFTNFYSPSEKKKINISELIKNKFTESFISLWHRWKDYKAKEFKFKYKSEESEAEALAELIKISGGDEFKATEIVKKSMANGWKGFFELKEPVSRAEILPVIAAASIKTHDVSKRTMNYLFDRYRENPHQITITSIDATDYDLLKRSGLIGFDNSKIAEIREQAIEYLRQNSREENEANINHYMKKFGVLAYFKQCDAENKESIFA
jgi:hypothetical protein